MRVISENKSTCNFTNNIYTVKVYGLWYDDSLSKALYEFSSKRLHIFISNKVTTLFRPSVLPKSILDDDEYMRNIKDVKEFNSIKLQMLRTTNGAICMRMYNEIN